MARQGSGAAVQAVIPRAGFSSQKAEKWIVVSALLTAAIYGFRRLVEGEGTPTPSTSKARAFLGQGTPPDFAQYLIAWGAGYGFLALFALAVPELAAAFAMLVLLVSVLESGGQLATDLQTIEHAAGTQTTGQAAVQGVTGAASAGGVTLGATAPSPQSVGAGVANPNAALNQQIEQEAKSLPAGYSVTIVNGVAELLHHGIVIDKG
jgi:hypothetical protein